MMLDTLLEPGPGDDAQERSQTSKTEKVESHSNSVLATTPSPPNLRAVENVRVTTQLQDSIADTENDTSTASCPGEEEGEREDRKLVKEVLIESETESETIRSSRSQRFKGGAIRTWQIHFINKWTLEWMAAVFGLCCLSAIYILVRIFNSRSLKEWHWYFSINTMLSALGTAMRFCAILVTGTSLAQLKWLWFTCKTRPFDDFGIYEAASHVFLVRCCYYIVYTAGTWHR